MITLETLKKLFPTTNSAKLSELVAPLNKTCERFKINTSLRQANFLAQVGHESGNMSARVENLNYSADALRRVFGKYFPTQALANAYARQPEKIANRVYGGRMSNGPEATGDGWRYRGRGLIQLTGKANYTAFAADMGMTLAEAVSYLESAEGACMSAGWFWNKNSLNALADKGDIVGTTKRINGGTNGLDHRKQLFEAAKKIL